MVWSTPACEVLIDIVTRPGQTDHGHGGTLAYGGKAGAPPQTRPPPAAPYAPQAYSPLRLHQPGYGSAALSYRDNSYVRSGGAVGDYRAGSRMSILGTGYLPPPAQHHPPPADPPPFKKIRLTAERPPTTSLPHHQPLRVDTRESTAYTVEVLSPNPPSEPTVEEQSFRTTKDDLLQQISKVDREMALSDATLSKLRKKQEELEQTASKPAQAAEPEEAVPRHRSLAQCVYADNRKKATSAHALLSHLGPPVLYPLYNQPQDTEVYHENIRRHRTFRQRLAEHIRRLKLEAQKREDALAEAYTRRATEWMRRVERIEQGQKRKAKDARNREFFEKVFPELRKAREERERFNRLGARVKSEAELEEIADGLHEQEHEDKKMRALTVVPPLLTDPEDTAPRYTDTNRRCMDMESEHKELQLRNVWSAAEREVFRDKYLQHPKNFGQIASFLPRKSVRDCVRFYYLSKKAENYKQLLRKPRQRRSARNPPRPPVEPELPAGVTTRLQRSQGTVSRVMIGESGVVTAGDGKEVDVESIPVTCIPVPPTAPLQPTRVELIRTPPLPPSPPPASSAPATLMSSTSTLTSTSLSTLTSTSLSIVGSPAPPTPPMPALEATTVTVTSADVTVTITAITTSSPPIPSPLPSLISIASIPSPAAIPSPPATTSVPTESTSVSDTSVTVTSVASVACTAVVTPTSASSESRCAIPTPTHPAQPVQPLPETAVTERSSSTPGASVTTTSITTSISSSCAVCEAPGASRTVSRSRASHYGLKEDMVGSRVCESCHSRCVVSRYTRCSVPRCGGPRVRARRLRHLPPRWHDLPLDAKRPIMEEFDIPSDLSKCCLACLKRITRRLEAAGATEPTDEEVARFRTLLRDHGTNWEAMAPHANKEPVSLKAFYFTYRKKLSLDAIVSERSNSSKGTDSSVSSGDSDTASAGDSPRRPPPPPAADGVHARRRRDEYDSSATETADEESESPSTTKALPPTTIPAPSSISSISSTTPLPPSPSTPATPSTSASQGQATPGVTAGIVTPAVLRNGPNPPQTVRDVVLNLIEISLTRDPQPPGIKPHQLKVSSSTTSRNDSLATLSVVSTAHPTTGARSPQRPATITPLQPADTPKEGVMLLHIEPRHERHDRERQEPLLDLSVKRRHDVAFQHPNKIYRNTDYQAYRAQPERESPTQYNSKPKPVATPPRPTLKPAPNKGSITLGTPVESRYDPRRTPPEPKGSITAGTPVHGTHHIPDKRGYDYFKRQATGGAYYSANQPRPHSPNFSPNNAPPYSRSPYGIEQQRQIIITDFITSQQMNQGTRRERAPSPTPYYPAQRREPPVSVIQRHYAPHTHHHPLPHPPPGHEAFTSLVDVASAATALPVPRGEAKPEPKQTQPHPQSHQPHNSHQPHQQHQNPHQQSPHQNQHGHQNQHQNHQSPHQQSPHQQSPHQQSPHQQSPHQQSPHQTSHQSGHQTSHQSPHQTSHQSPHQQSPHQPSHQTSHQSSHQPSHQQGHQAQPHHHDIRLSMNLHTPPQKYHPQQIQYQVLERRAQAQFLERDRQIAIQQQRRDNERAMAAIQERHAMEQQQQILHERQMQAHSAASEADSQAAAAAAAARRGCVAGAGAAYSVPRHRAPPITKPDTSRPAVSAAPAPAPAAAAGVPRTEGTLTAASLIDAIITHQISQHSDRFPRDCENSNPPTERAPAPAPPPPQPMDRDEHPPLHTTSFKLGDLASNIITRDFQSPATSTLIHNNRFPASSSDTMPAGNRYPANSSDGYTATSSSNAPSSIASLSSSNDEWKRREQNPKHAPFLEPVSPPDNVHNNRGNSTARRYGCGAGGFATAYDYVTTRIVEVMRSDADERTKIPQFPTQYAFPYNALNVATPPDGTTPTSAPAPSTPAAPPPPEPAPLMSAQYEPLSDED